MNTKQTVNENKAEEKVVTPTPAAESKSVGKAIMKTIKHTAHVAASDAAIIGCEIKTASKEFASNAVKDGKAMCACSEKAVLTATEKVLKAASHSAAKSAKSVHKAAESK